MSSAPSNISMFEILFACVSGVLEACSKFLVRKFNFLLALLNFCVWGGILTSNLKPGHVKKYVLPLIVCVNLCELASRLKNECLVSSSSCPILMSNWTFWFHRAWLFFGMRRKLFIDPRDFSKVEYLEFWFRVEDAVWHASFSCVENVAFLKSWILGAGLTMSRTLQTWRKKSATFEESPSGCQNGLWKMCQIFVGLWGGSPRLCGRSAICGDGCRHQMCMVWIMGIRDRC